MFQPIKMMDIELNRPLEDIEDLSAYGALRALVRLHGAPIGYVSVPLSGDRLPAAQLGDAIAHQLSFNMIRHVLPGALLKPIGPEGINIGESFKIPPAEYSGPWPSVTVAVCTRDRPADLAICLEALAKLDYHDLDILLVDNAPHSDAAKQLVNTHYPQIRYVCEPRPGLNWARNRAVLEARGEIVAFTDDDVVVEPEWVSAVARVFAESSEVMAVTGLVVPFELETRAQFLFESSGGFGRGFRRKWYQLDRQSSKRTFVDLGAGAFGTGANMAFRRCVFNQIGGFDPALDVGTVTHGGGDLEMFFRVIQEGQILVYEPRAVVRHRHRLEYAELRSQLFRNGIGLYAYFTRSAVAYPRLRYSYLCFGLWWLWHRHIRRLIKSVVRPGGFPRDLILAELRGSLLGFIRYHKARRNAAHNKWLAEQLPGGQSLNLNGINLRSPSACTERMIDLGKPLQPLNDVKAFAGVRICVTLDGGLLGTALISNFGQSISLARLRDAVAESIFMRYRKLNPQRELKSLWSAPLKPVLRQKPSTGIQPPIVASHLSVSVVVATRDRPDELRQCLHFLLAQQTPRRVEIIVVDNNPASGLTPPVAAQFPGVVLVNEQRQGLAYARNAGFAASTGDIVATTDDDVILPQTWLEKMVVPFAHSDVMAVTGNVLPFEMQTPAQHLFEAYGGLGRGIVPIEANRNWFNSYKVHAVPTWTLGATANAAFRAAIFSRPDIGLMEEALGPGMPSGVGEDTYLFYKILKAGHTIVYDPAAYVWHKHRRDMKSLRSQIYNYSKGHVAYHLTTWLLDRDARGLLQVAVWLPNWHRKRIKDTIFGRSNYPLSLIILEVLGNLVGPFALLKSFLRVRREGRSTACRSWRHRAVVACAREPVEPWQAQ